MKTFIVISLALLSVTLFQEVKGEQMLRRRLTGLNTITKPRAEENCKAVKDAVNRQHCVFDVLATQDLDMVNIYID
jgi:hypothetical protein